MADYSPPIYGVEYIFYVSLVSQADTKLLKSNPTLASGDVVISKDGGTAANLTTLPTVTPASGKFVKVTVSATEMQCANAMIIFSDAAGAEWCDLSINVQPSKNPRVISVVGSASTTTSIVTSSMLPAAAVTDQFKGRIVVFDSDTTTANLRGQATDITASTAGGVLTVTALSTAPVSGDTFRIY